MILKSIDLFIAASKYLINSIANTKKEKLDQFPPKKRMYTNDKQHLVGPDYHHIDSTTSKLTQIEQQKRQKEELRALQIAELNKYMDKILDQHPSFGCTDKCVMFMMSLSILILIYVISIYILVK